MERPLILLCNDDGVGARGIRAVAQALADLGEVLVVAPDRERSATGHAISLEQPLRTEQVEPGWFAVSGTPCDCAYIGLLHIVPRRPALCVSGINHGYNLGSDVFYSGTLAAAVEAAIRGVPAFAISLGPTPTRKVGDASFEPAARFAHALARAVLQRGLPPQTLLNVNVPAVDRLSGYRWTRLGKRIYRDQVDVRQDLRGRSYYWIGGPEVGFGDVPGSDCFAVRDGYASVTPLDLDLTHHGLLEKLTGWELGGFEAVLEEETPAG